MEGTMQDFPLMVTSILDFAERWHGEQEVISREVDGETTVSNYRELARSARLTSLALRALGVRPGDCIGTMAWNTVRHMHCWYGIAGSGAVCHTLNPRLFVKDLEYIINHAQDKIIFLDAPLAAIAQQFLPNTPSVQTFIVLTSSSKMPKIEAKPGTTGRPKGVAYTHRSQFLHCMQLGTSNALSMGMHSTVLMIVPMFHANAWGHVFGAPMYGCRLVLPGPDLSGKTVCALMHEHNVTVAAGVPTVFGDLLLHLEKSGRKLPRSLTHINVGGSAMPTSMMQTYERLGIHAVHAWGMTELSPMGTMCVLKPYMQNWSEERKTAVKSKQGIPGIFTDLRIVDDKGKELPRDGKHMGELQAKGAHTTKSYLKVDKPAVDAEGWFSTGDVATIDEHGYMQITDRSKDVIKSGGEWISSIEIENMATAHPQVAEAAVVAMPHEKWGERPLLVVVAKRKGAVSKEAILEHLKGKLAKWWTPDEVVFVDELPHTATGKISKLQLRQQFKKSEAASQGRSKL
ncbi:hypothetical protein WJX73_007789 [Symbiochloris irregularis]|uniref:Long-chain fatty acid--CoA ligase n=1 Tax=Symbiochloris irregularis TaxID=706552 RepID=A0AAW1P7P4_9CHLO